MVRKTKVVLIDDIDGTEAFETVKFGIDGVAFEIDLSQKHAEELRDAVEPFATRARRVGKPRLQKTAAAAPPVRNPERAERNRRIRDWAAANGHDVSAKGRIPDHVAVAFDRAAAAPTTA